MRSANAAWRRLLEGLRAAPVVAPRGQPTRERLAGSLTFSSSLPLIAAPARKLNYRFAAAEALWMVTGRDDVAALARVNPKMAAYSDDGVRLAGAYGPRFVGQLPYVLRVLQRDPASRQAVVEIWRPEPAPSKDVPCTLSWQFLLREGRLHLVATMRSSDAWLGVPYDAFSFAVVLQFVAGLVGATPGEVTINMGSSHLYQPHWELAEALLLRGSFDPPPRINLEPLREERAAFEALAAAALGGSPYQLRHPKLPGWSRLFRATQAASSREALEALTR